MSSGFETPQLESSPLLSVMRSPYTPIRPIQLDNTSQDSNNGHSQYFYSDEHVNTASPGSFITQRRFENLQQLLAEQNHKLRELQNVKEQLTGNLNTQVRLYDKEVKRQRELKRGLKDSLAANEIIMDKLKENMTENKELRDVNKGLITVVESLLSHFPDIAVEKVIAHMEMGQWSSAGNLAETLLPNIRATKCVKSISEELKDISRAMRENVEPVLLDLVDSVPEVCVLYQKKSEEVAHVRKQYEHILRLNDRMQMVKQDGSVDINEEKVKNIARLRNIISHDLSFDLNNLKQLINVTKSMLEERIEK
ncbi:hypothetical protein PCE1_001233 [Barthelona sp. PCE]